MCWWVVEGIVDVAAAVSDVIGQVVCVAGAILDLVNAVAVHCCCS